MTKPKAAPRARYTLAFKREAVRLVESGQSIAGAARTVGVVDQTLFNWVKASRQGRLTGASSNSVSAEQKQALTVVSGGTFANFSAANTVNHDVKYNSAC